MTRMKEDGFLVGEWTTKDGRSVKIRDMTNSHLINAIRYIRRRHYTTVFCDAMLNSARAYQYAAHAPEGASYAAEQAASEMMTSEGFDEIFGEDHPAYLDLLNEAKRRNLTDELGEWSANKEME